MAKQAENIKYLQFHDENADDGKKLKEIKYSSANNGNVL